MRRKSGKIDFGTLDESRIESEGRQREKKDGFTRRIANIGNSKLRETDAICAKPCTGLHMSTSSPRISLQGRLRVTFRGTYTVCVCVCVYPPIYARRSRVAAGNRARLDMIYRVRNKISHVAYLPLIDCAQSAPSADPRHYIERRAIALISSRNLRAQPIPAICTSFRESSTVARN